MQRNLQYQKGKGNALVDTKTRSSRRLIHMPEIANQALIAHRARQIEEGLRVGPDWPDTGLVFTTTGGLGIAYSSTRSRFQALLKRAGLESIRPHDLRHTATLRCGLKNCCQN